MMQLNFSQLVIIPCVVAFNGLSLFIYLLTQNGSMFEKKNLRVSRGLGQEGLLTPFFPFPSELFHKDLS